MLRRHLTIYVKMITYTCEAHLSQYLKWNPTILYHITKYILLSS